MSRFFFSFFILHSLLAFFLLGLLRYLCLDLPLSRHHRALIRVISSQSSLIQALIAVSLPSRLIFLFVLLGYFDDFSFIACPGRIYRGNYEYGTMSGVQQSRDRGLKAAATSDVDLP